MCSLLVDPLETLETLGIDTARSGTLPVMRPQLPSADALLPYLREIDDNRWYSNNGPLEQEFERRLSGVFGLSGALPILTSSGTTALQITIAATALAGRRKCLIPSWTFVATALAAVHAGLEPHFADVDLATWALSPEAVLERADLHELAAIVVVAPFGQTPDIQAWNKVQRLTGIPVIIDAAASFDGLSQSGDAAHSTAPIVVSLHATKALGIGEGGVVLTQDQNLERLLRAAKNFGFDGSRDALLPGTNAKLSEYHCAVGMAALDGWPVRRAALYRAHSNYMNELKGCSHISLPPPSLGQWVATTFNVMVDQGQEHARIVLSLNGIETRQWWGHGCHRQPAFAHAPHDPLPNTRALAEKVLGLPFWADLSLEDIQHICAILRNSPT